MENTLCHEIQLARRHLDWSDDDVHSIVNRLVGWWDADKKNLKRTDVAGPFGPIADEFKERFLFFGGHTRRDDHATLQSD